MLSMVPKCGFLPNCQLALGFLTGTGMIYKGYMPCPKMILKNTNDGHGLSSLEKIRKHKRDSRDEQLLKFVLSHTFHYRIYPCIITLEAEDLSTIPSLPLDPSTIMMSKPISFPPPSPQ